MSKKRVCEPLILAFSATFSPKNSILVNTLLMIIIRIGPAIATTQPQGKNLILSFLL